MVLKNAVQRRDDHYTTLEMMIIPRPIAKNMNINARSLFVPEGAFLNSFQMKTPHNAATIVAPCPKP
jgi:hypothetical protein